MLKIINTEKSIDAETILPRYLSEEIDRSIASVLKNWLSQESRKDKLKKLIKKINDKN